MKRMRLRKLRHKLYLSYGVMIAVLCAVIGVSYVIARETIKRGATESVESSLYTTAQAVEAVNRKVGQFYDLIYNSNDVRDRLNRMRTADGLERHYHYGKLNSLMNSFLLTLLEDSQQYEVILASGAGDEVYYYSWTQDWPDTALLAEALAPGGDTGHFRVYCAPSYQPQNQGEPYLYYTRPMRSNSYHRSPDISVVIGVRLSAFRALYATAAAENSTFRFLDHTGAPIPGLAEDSGGPAAGKIRSEARLPALGWTMVQSVPTEYVLADLNRWSGLVIVGIVALVAAVAVVCAYIGNRISRPIQLLHGDMQAIQAGSRVYGGGQRRFADDEIGELSRQFYDMVENIHRLGDRMLEEERQKRLLEFQALQNQINPHFLYNTLGSIKMLVRLGRKDQSVSALTALTGILRDTLGKTGQTATLEQELHTLESYVYIQKLRYCSFQFHIDMPEELYPLRILRFLLQPFLENSIFHGYEQIGEDAVITVAFCRRGDPEALEVTIRDNGRGMEPGTLRAVGRERRGSLSGIGVANVVERIRLTYGEPYGVRFESEPGQGTAVRLWLPIITEEAAYEA